ncbi:AAA family ATPase [Streptomyces sp. 4N509B]|uniref:AAA family ATPase n=1 Tax=Streptomyces sp. 4N509B TaxID=3457413 RepID=UPI003FD1B161
MRSVAFASRNRQTKKLHHLLIRCRADGNARTVAITGAFGSGKTTMINGFAEDARRNGALVLTATGSRHERAFPLGVVSQLLASAGPDAPGSTPGTASVSASPAEVMRDAFASLTELATRNTVVVAIDDAHLSDTLSLFCVSYLLSSMPPLPIMAVLTGPPEITRVAGHGCGPAGMTTHLRLDPLSEPEVHLLATQALTGPVSDAFVHDCHAASGGSPLLAGALISDSRASATGDAVVAGEEFAEAVRRFLHRGPDTVLQVASTAAVLGDDGSADLLGRTSDLDAAGVTQALALLNDAGLLDGTRFRHARTRDLVLDRISPWDRVRMHRRAADVLRASGASEQAWSRHVAAARRLSVQWIPPMPRLSDQARPEESDADLVYLCLESAALSTVAERGPAAGGRGPAGADTAAPAAAPVVSADPVGRRTRAEPVLDPRRRVERAFTTIVTEGPNAMAVARLEQALHQSPLEHATVDTIALALSGLVYSDLTSRARPWCDQFLREAANGPAHWQARFAAIRAEVALRGGEFERAVADADAALHHASVEAWGVGVGEPLATYVMGCTALGEHHKAESLLALELPDEIIRSRFALPYINARGHHHQATNRLSAALDDFLTCGELAAEWGLDQPAFVSWRTGAAQTFLRLGDHDRARQLLDEQLVRLGQTPGRTRGVTLRLLAMTRDGEERRAVLSSAVGELERHRDAHELSLARRDLAEVEARLSDESAPRTLALSKAPLSGPASRVPGAGRPAARMAGTAAQAQVSALGVQPAARPESAIERLSEAEWRVVTLVARGHTNKAIATRLYITVSTVEQHLTRVYRKLGVRHRKDLVAYIDRSGRTAGREGVGREGVRRDA